MFKKFSIAIVGTALLVSGGVVAAQESTLILESVPFDSVDTGTAGGFTVNDEQFLGWRFDLDSPLQVTDIGGAFFSFSFDSEIFGAIISLSGPDALPLGSPFLPEEVLAVTTFTTPLGHNDLLTPLEVKLEPGNYGLVFGSGLFGATGSSTMSFLNGRPPGSSEFFRWDVDPPPIGARWRSPSSPKRFVIVGSTSVPETSPRLSLLALGTLGLGSALLRSQTEKNN